MTAGCVTVPPARSAVPAALLTGAWPRESTLVLESHAAESVPTARRHTMQVLAAWNVPADLAYEVQLVVSELVTNAQAAMKRHLSREPLILGLVADISRLVVEVSDTVPRELPRYRDYSRTALRGRGLDIISQTCHGWGYMQCPGGDRKVVFASFELG